MKDLFLTLHRYHLWVNDRVIPKLSELSEEQLKASTGQSHGNLLDLLYHMMRVEWLWLGLAQYQKLDGRPPAKADYTTVMAILERWQEEIRTRQTYLEAVSEAELEANVQITDREGNTETFKRWQLLMHLFNHSMQHRTEIAAILTSYDRSPGDLDLIFFFDSEK